MKDIIRKKLYILRRLSRQMKLYGIGGSEVRLNGARDKSDENIEYLIKLYT